MTSERWVRVRHEGVPRHGLVDGDAIVLIDGDMFGEWRRSETVLSFAETPLLAPVFPPTFYACGINYVRHAHTASAEFGLDLDKLLPKAPEVGYRAQSAIIGPGEPIVIPADAPANVQAEGELCVVIGRQARHVAEADALDHVFGYTICVDVSQRDWQFVDRTFWRSKNSDTFKPMGPWIVRTVAFDTLETRVSVNGDVKDRFATGNMIYSVAAYIAAISRYITLVPGDVIIMGSDGHTPRIAAGDTLTVEIDGIGALTNPVVRAQQ